MSTAPSASAVVTEAGARRQHGCCLGESGGQGGSSSSSCCCCNSSSSSMWCGRCSAELCRPCASVGCAVWSKEVCVSLTFFVCVCVPCIPNPTEPYRTLPNRPMELSRIATVRIPHPEGCARNPTWTWSVLYIHGTVNCVLCWQTIHPTDTSIPPGTTQQRRAQSSKLSGSTLCHCARLG